MGNQIAARGLTPLMPKRSRAKWRVGAPDYICDVFDHPGEDDRYTVFLTGPGWIGEMDPRAPFIGCDSHGRCHLGEITPYELRRYRGRNAKRRAAWSSLPAAVRKAVTSYAASC